MVTDVWGRLRDYARTPDRRVIGLMTGTSADAVDAALVRFEGEGERARPVLERYRETPLGHELRREVLEAASAESWRPEELMRLDAVLGERYAEAVADLLRDASIDAHGVDAIASHGQTVRHVPRAAGGGKALTLQIGSAAILAERTGILVVSDFRSRDTAAGGEGAPLVPMADARLFGSDKESRVLLNLGGMANLTHLPRTGTGEPIAFDTGPGNAVMDALAESRSGGHESHDPGGRFAATGRAHEELLRELLEDPFFAQPPPRSTGRERFGVAFARSLRERGLARGCSEADLARTALELTAASVADAIARFVRGGAPGEARSGEAGSGGVDAVYASGGGVANETLMRSLANRLSPIRVESLERLGVPPAAKEAMAFALLGHLTLCGIPGNLTAATGASRPVVLGHLTPGR